MNDFRDLKAIAQACQKHQPLRFMRSHGALYIRNDNGIVFDVHQNRSFPEFMAQNKDYADLVLAANPATVLALIAENERLRADLDGEMDQARDFNIEHAELQSERDHLKAENEALRKDAERYRWLREQNWAISEMAVATYPKESIKLGYDCPFGDRLDSAIDAAMGRGEQP